MSTSFPFFFFFGRPPWGLMPNTCVAFFSINIRFLEICVMAEISLFFFLTCITRVEGPSNLYCVVEILHAYSV